MQKSVVKGALNNSFIVSFSTDKDRTKGIGTLFKSSYQFRALSRNKFVVDKEVLESKLFEGKNINYRIIDKK